MPGWAFCYPLQSVPTSTTSPPPNPSPSLLVMVHNIDDITPNSTATKLLATHTKCNWIIISAPTANAGDMRVGDSNTSATSGATIAKGTNTTLWPIGDDLYLDLALIYVYGTSTDKVGILYGSH